MTRQNRLWSANFSKLCTLVLILFWSVIASDPAHADPRSTDLGSSTKQITIIGTNDIHGGLEPTSTRNGKRLGGLAYQGGIIRTIKRGIQNQFASDAGVLVLDAGDQFQGTLLSNYSEGELTFQVLNQIPYDAVVPGNHDYDFGPLGWLNDQVTPDSADQNPRGALEKIVKQVSFPLLSANTFYKASIRTLDGTALGLEQTVQSEGCLPKAQQNSDLPPTVDPTTIEIAWDHALQPPFLKPYVIKNIAGVRVALIGLDHYQTATMTTQENVSDLCFANEAETYSRLRNELSGKADVFILMIHQGNSSNEAGLTRIIQSILKRSPDGIDAVIAGHTHFVNHLKVDQIPIIQSGSGASMFGRIDLFYSPREHKILKEKTNSWAGLRMEHGTCPLNVPLESPPPAATPVTEPMAISFCKQNGKDIYFEGELFSVDSNIESIITNGVNNLAPIASRKLGTATGVIKRDRIAESPLANALTDAVRELANADISFLNTGGIRNDLMPGDVLYRHLFEVIPFGNHLVTLNEMPFSKIMNVLTRSALTCGSYGALMQSGLKVTIEKHCENNLTEGVDKAARIIQVVLHSGKPGQSDEILYQADTQTDWMSLNGNRKFKVVTVDFLAAGGSGYDGFKGVSISEDLGIMRESMTENYLKNPATFKPEIDGRWLIQR